MQQAQSRQRREQHNSNSEKGTSSAVQLQSTGERINIVYPKLGCEEVLNNRQFIN